MQLQFDRSGFPVVRLEELSVSLLPITKIQFERFIAQPNPFGDTWYDQILGINPRLSWRRADLGPREELFITGVLPSEAVAYASWAGLGFDLPSVAEWRMMYRVMTKTPLALNSLRGLESEDAHPGARAIVESILSQAHPRTWAELALLQGGLIEWVRDGEGFKGLGFPRPQFWSITSNPMNDDELLFLLHNERSRYFGFRLVRRRSKRPGGEKS